tara:strand:- start:293 stop:508 length:216 start_codon:yes stop_codon:yes gene_type:complete
MIMDFIYSMELYELIATSLVFGFSTTVLISWLVLDYQERKLDRANQEQFADEYGIPYWVRATDEQIGITNR